MRGLCTDYTRLCTSYAQLCINYELIIHEYAPYFKSSCIAWEAAGPPWVHYWTSEPPLSPPLLSPFPYPSEAPLPPHSPCTLIIQPRWSRAAGDLCGQQARGTLRPHGAGRNVREFMHSPCTWINDWKGVGRGLNWRGLFFSSLWSRSDPHEGVELDREGEEASETVIFIVLWTFSDIDQERWRRGGSDHVHLPHSLQQCNKFHAQRACKCEFFQGNAKTHLPNRNTKLPVIDTWLLIILHMHHLLNIIGNMLNEFLEKRCA